MAVGLDGVGFGGRGRAEMGGNGWNGVGLGLGAVEVGWGGVGSATRLASSLASGGQVRAVPNSGRSSARVHTKLGGTVSCPLILDSFTFSTRARISQCSSYIECLLSKRNFPKASNALCLDKLTKPK